MKIQINKIEQHALHVSVQNEISNLKRLIKDGDFCKEFSHTVAGYNERIEVLEMLSLKLLSAK